MSTYYETGHSKNVANLEDVISYCVGYGVTNIIQKNHRPTRTPAANNIGFISYIARAMKPML